MAENVTKDFIGLPLGLLVCQPILEVAKGQAALCDVYLEYLFEIAFEAAKENEPRKAKVISFTLNRPVTHEDGSIQMLPIKVEAPILSLVPIPAFTMDETTVRFTMEVRSQDVDKSGGTTTASTGLSYSGWGCKANITGSVTTTRENTRTTDKSAKYEIYARAAQQPPAEGMAKLTNLLASVIEPIPAS